MNTINKNYYYGYQDYQAYKKAMRKGRAIAIAVLILILGGLWSLNIYLLLHMTR